MLPPQVKARVAVEQASTFGWERYTGLSGKIWQKITILDRSMESSLAE